MTALMGHGNTVSLSPCSSHRWTTLLWVLLTLLSQVWSFNLDTTHTLHKLGDHGTFFGFSLALHQQLTPEPQSWWVSECGTEIVLCVLWDFWLNSNVWYLVSAPAFHTKAAWNIHSYFRAVKSWNFSCVATTLSISMLPLPSDLLNHCYTDNSEVGAGVLACESCTVRALS